MSQYTSYWLYQRYEQRGDQDPIPTYPNVYSVDADGTMPLVVRRENDDQCGWYCDPPVYQWATMPITEDYICESCQESETLIRYVQTDYTVCSYEDETPYEDMYFTIVPKTDGGILLSGSSLNPGIFYSIDDTDEWITTATSSTLLVQMEIGHRYKIKSSGGLVKIIQLRGNWMNVEYPYDFFYDVEGNIMSLLYGDDFIGKTDIPESKTFYGLFSDCYGLISAKNLVLPPTTVTGVYSNMFKNCALLEDAPTLPATIISDGCYREMFKNCVSLKTAPALPATDAPTNCYYEMFKGCVSLTKAPELPAATTVERGAYEGMFRGCVSLVTGPSELPAVEVRGWAYSEMFAECISLTAAPTVLPATTLGKDCYYSMFAGCASLTQVPTVLPATTLSEACYHAMFSGCTSLTVAPELPATTLTKSCYGAMFEHCSSLTKAPDLPAEYLEYGCYTAMFLDCTNLNYIRCLARSITAQDCTVNWVVGVQTESGTFVTPASTGWIRGVNGIPVDWTRVDA